MPSAARARFLLLGGLAAVAALGAWWLLAPPTSERLAQLMEARRWQEAETLAREALDDAGREEHALLYAALARAHERQQEYPEALAAYRSAYALRPQDEELRRRAAIALVGIGRGHQERGEYEQALARYREAVETAPEIPHGHRALVAALRALGRSDEAIEALDAALDAGPHDRVHLLHLAWLLATHPDPERRDPERAVDLAYEVLLHDRTPETLDTYAVALAARGDYAEAVRFEVDAIQLAGGRESPRFEERRARLQAFVEERPHIEPTAAR